MNPSDVIEQRYRLERLLGTGGMSEVWLAEDTRLGRWVAVKILRDSIANREDDLVDTLVQEARVVARLQHPNIVGVHDYGTHDGHHFLVMEYVHGYSARQLLQNNGRLAESEAIRYGSQVAGGLQYAHEQHVIHCDVKPENILVTEQGVAKIADFGVAETVSRTLAPEQMRDVLGTVAYLAPEVIQGASADPRSDVYSLALTVYEMVAGRLPFAGTSAAALAGQRLGTPAPPLRSFAMDASPELEAVLARALAISPQDRYPTAAALAQALRGVPQGRRQGSAVPTMAPPERVPAARSHHTTRLRRPPPPRRRGGTGWNSTGVAALIGAVLVALGVAVAAAIILSQDDDNGGGNGTPTPQTQSPTTGTPETPTRQPTTPATPTAATPTEQATPTPTTAPPTAPATATPTRPATPASPTAGASPTATQQTLLPGLGDALLTVR